MAPILRVKARWSGFQGSPGYSIFHFRDFSSTTFTTTEASQSIANVRAFFLGMSNSIPAIVSIDVESTCEIVDHDNGQLIDVITGNSVSTVTGSASGTAPFSGPVGAVVTWRTTQVRNGRRIRGRTFVVPLSSVAFESNGTLASGAMSAINSAAEALRTSSSGPDFGVWARPSGPGATDGEFAPAMGHSVPDIGAVLRSRRD